MSSFQEIKDKAKALGEAAKEAAKEAAHKVADKASDLASDTKNKAGDVLHHAADALKKKDE